MGKRIAAWIGIVLLVLLYVSTLVIALTGKGDATRFLMLSIVMTVIIPVFLYVYIRLFDILKNKKPLDNEDQLITFDNRAPREIPLEPVDDESEDPVVPAPESAKTDAAPDSLTDRL